ncbi:acetolactate synthase AlsS [Secundilactobacillus kimchicus]|uniref:Acetolactate synthase n=1 Tax=Secundilactobacillus kimchicus JCM 15530 TaxID=1302272 RepID=A0A0R1HQ06_9LACO|nr:acetolactate synthase AlsS [Secundilactobacillus kimchicus]KRK48511.1 acetolactate synthase [Secundilactobacillus kimchicus JCM 15530]MBT9671257.1 acetolactate synthase AlsS [Secundilactobacillus kimchicus]
MTISKNGAAALVQSMINQGVKYVFGIPGAKVDQLFDLLENTDNPAAPQLIVTRHEQNAALIAAGIGRLTGVPGVVAVTSGPGVSNLATGLITATSEADPVIAIGGQVPRGDLSRLTHQSIASTALLKAATKSSVEVETADNLSEVFANAYNEAVSPKPGATFISIPKDVLSEPVTVPEIKALKPVHQGQIDTESLATLVSQLKTAKRPAILVGMRGSTPAVAEALQKLLRRYHVPVVETFQGSGVISHDLEDQFFGRVGLFHNQIGDQLLQNSDLVLTVGYDPVEYEARFWNPDRTGQTVAIDSVTPEISTDYQPDLTVVADIAASLNAVAAALPEGLVLADEQQRELQDLRTTFAAQNTVPDSKPGQGVHPLAIVAELQRQVTDETTVTVDVGSHYIWMDRHFRSYNPRHLLFSNGMQTLGVALPWAIAAALVRPGKPVISISGDGGFLFSGQELETAVRLNLNIVQLIWNDGFYDMVKFQEKAHYGRDAGVTLGAVDYVKYAESFGAQGLRAETPAELQAALTQALATDGPSLIDIPVDYRDNIRFVTDSLADL